jgi:hypothetical protein
VKEEAPIGPIEPAVTACRIDNDELLIAAGSAFDESLD